MPCAVPLALTCLPSLGTADDILLPLAGVRGRIPQGAGGAVVEPQGAVNASLNRGKGFIPGFQIPCSPEVSATVLRVWDVLNAGVGAGEVWVQLNTDLQSWSPARMGTQAMAQGSGGTGGDCFVCGRTGSGDQSGLVWTSRLIHNYGNTSTLVCFQDMPGSDLCVLCRGHLPL
jgi:hypothetical protein